MKEITVKLTLLEDMLGTASADKEIHETYIASKADDAPSVAEEIEALGFDEVVEKGMTVFPRDKDGCPIIWDYQIKGMFKDACGMLRKIKGTKSSEIKAFKKEIDGLIFPFPRKIRINLSGPMGNLQRPLRASTAQGERVALANSETVPAGSTITFSVKCLVDNQIDLVKEWLDYGELRGLGQWRNAGYGRFTYEVI